MLVVMYGAVGLLATGCHVNASDPKAEAPPPLKLKRMEDRAVFEVEGPERFRVEPATSHTATSELRVTGTVNPDIARNVPVISLASGRVIEIRSEEHTSELQSLTNLVCRLLLEKKKPSIDRPTDPHPRNNNQ